MCDLLKKLPDMRVRIDKVDEEVNEDGDEDVDIDAED